VLRGNIAKELKHMEKPVLNVFSLDSVSCDLNLVFGFFVLIIKQKKQDIINTVIIRLKNKNTSALKYRTFTTAQKITRTTGASGSWAKTKLSPSPRRCVS